MEPQAVVPPSVPVNPEPQAAPQASTGSSNVPASWPGGFSLFKYAKNAYMVNLGPNLIILVLSIIIGYPLQKALGNTGTLIAELLAIVLSVASTRLYLAGGRGRKMSFGQAFPADFMLYVKFLGLQIVVGLTVILSLLLLIIPFFFVYPRLTLANYFLLDKNMGVMEAYKASWAATKGNLGKVWGIIGVSIVFAILIIVLVGIYLSIMYATAYALLYLFLQQSPAAAAEPTVPAAPNPPAPEATPQPPVSSAPQNTTPPQVQ